MKKDHLKVIKDAIDNLTEQDGKFDSLVADAIGEIDKEVENLGNLKDKLEDEFEELSDNQQEGDEGTALQEAIEAIEEAKTDLEGIKDELDDAPFDDIINKLGEFTTTK
jgi:DNA repair exonuclease SbcCD ATPase subunit